MVKYLDGLKYFFKNFEIFSRVVMCKHKITFCFTFIDLLVEVVEENEVELCEMQLLEFVHHHA